MPLTISHAAAVLPLSRTRLPLAALMIGSMSPDFAYFLPWEFQRASSHSISGLFWFCWPAGLLMWLLFVHLLEEPTIALLPQRWRAAITRSDRSLGLRTLVLASLAVIVGAITHDVWDQFTHGNSILAHWFPVSHAEIGIFGAHLHLHRLLQHLSSIGGLVVLAVWAFNRVRQTPATESSQPGAYSVTLGGRIFALLAMCGLSAALAASGYLAYPEYSIGVRLFHLAVGGMAGWALAWCAVAIAIRVRH